MKKKKIAVIFGGRSPEYEVSLKSAAAVVSNMDKERYEPLLLGISPGGDWYLCLCGPEEIEADRWQEGDCFPAAISPRASDHGVLVFRGDTLELVRVDAAFPVLHGKYGEDGCVQGLCALGGIAVAGCSVTASALGMDKARAHILSEAAGVPCPRGFVLERGQDIGEAERQAERLGYPLFVKPVKAGSSFGISRISGPEELAAALEEAFRYDERVIMEESIPGFEVGCAVLGNGELITGEPDEIELSGGFFDYGEKYGLLSSRIHVPARLSPQKRWEIKETAKRIYRALDCRGFARVDMFLNIQGQLLFNEVNTIPGFTAHSRFPSMMRAVGMDFKELISRIIELAVEQ